MASTQFTQDVRGNQSNSLLSLGSLSLPRTMSRQLSIYSLTLDEFQSSLGEPGKNFGSMNMDELLKNIWTAEESQAMAAAMFSNNGSSGDQTGIQREPSLIQRQNSLLPQSIGKKTVDEVWRDIGAVPEVGIEVQQMKPRQGTYGEMTLEDFLVKAGVMAPETVQPMNPAPFYGTASGTGTGGGFNTVQSSGMTPILGGMTGLMPGKKEPMELNDPMLGIGLAPSTTTATNHIGYAPYNNGNSMSAAAQAARNHAEWIENQYKNSTALAQQQQLMQMAMMNGSGMGGIVKENSPGSPMSDAHPGGFVGMDGPIRGRKRILDAPLEKIVERRQRRMIKNRESAARSRARKQAYTVELEAEVTQLKEENMRLRKMQEEENLQRKKQVLEVIAPMTRHLPKMLRRTVTGPW